METVQWIIESNVDTVSTTNQIQFSSYYIGVLAETSLIDFLIPAQINRESKTRQDKIRFFILDFIIVGMFF